MYELRNHQVKVSFMIRAGPVPPGLQNAILAVFFYSENLFPSPLSSLSSPVNRNTCLSISLSSKWVYNHENMNKVSPMSLPLYSITTLIGMLIKEIPYVYIGSSGYY